MYVTYNSYHSLLAYQYHPKAPKIQTPKPKPLQPEGLNAQSPKARNPEIPKPYTPKDRNLESPKPKKPEEVTHRQKWMAENRVVAAEAPGMKPASQPQNPKREL